jgi:putative thioredoxin
VTEPDSRRKAVISAALSEADLSALKARFAAASGPASAPTSASSPDRAATSTGSPIVDVTDATFQAEVVERSLQVPVIVDLWASWCGPCSVLSPALERLATEANGAWILAKVNADANPGIPQRFGLQLIPMVVVIKGGQPLDAFAGVPKEPAIRQWLSGLLDAAAS